MALAMIISDTIFIIRNVYRIAVAINQSENLHDELRKMANNVSVILEVVERLMDQLRQAGNRVTESDEKFITHNITSIQSIVKNIEDVLEKVQADRNIIQRIFMHKDKYQRQLNQYTDQLTAICKLIQDTIHGAVIVAVSARNFGNFRTQFRDLPNKEVTIFNFSVGEDTPDSIVKILKLAIEQFDPTKYFCYMKLNLFQFFISYQLRTWSTPNILTLVAKHREIFINILRNGSAPNPTESNSNLNSHSSPHSVSSKIHAASNINQQKLDFSEFIMSHEYVCGMAMTPKTEEISKTQEMIYIATKRQINVYSLDKKKIRCQYGINADGSYLFEHISYIYIPPNDKTNLYIVDRGQNAVHRYRIDDSGRCFEFIHRYVVIGKNIQSYILQSCVIHGTNLYVSDSGNNCIHIFPLNGQRQSFYLSDDSVTPFSPGPMCTHENSLYVADCSAERPSILVLNEECEPINWIRNQSFQQILAIDIEPTINELFVLTTTTIQDENNQPKKRPLIVSMDLTR